MQQQPPVGLQPRFKNHDYRLWAYSCVFEKRGYRPTLRCIYNHGYRLQAYSCVFEKRGYRFKKKKIYGYFFPPKNSKLNTNLENSKSNTNLENSKSNTIYSQYKHNVLQNIRTQTHESPLIPQNQPKSNTKSIQKTQKHKLKNTNPFKHKHNISNTIAQIQAQIQIKTDTNIARISTSFKIFNISSIFLLTKHKITKKKKKT